MSAVADRFDELQDLDVNVLAVSTDKVFTLKMWEEQELSKMVDGGIPYPMVGDPTAEIGKTYGVYDVKNGVHVRGRFIIDPDGIIQAQEVLTDPVGRNVDELIRQVKGFQHNRDTGEATPAGWTPGGKTLSPGPDLVGKVWKEWNPQDR